MFYGSQSFDTLPDAGHRAHYAQHRQANIGSSSADAYSAGYGNTQLDDINNQKGYIYRAVSIRVAEPDRVLIYVAVEREVGRTIYAIVVLTIQILPKNPISRLPNTRPRIIVPRPEVI